MNKKFDRWFFLSFARSQIPSLFLKIFIFFCANIACSCNIFQKIRMWLHSTHSLLSRHRHLLLWLQLYHHLRLKCVLFFVSSSSYSTATSSSLLCCMDGGWKSISNMWFFRKREPLRNWIVGFEREGMLFTIPRWMVRDGRQCFCWLFYT